jgi:DNA-3-methyladenine glycosylase I
MGDSPQQPHSEPGLSRCHWATGPWLTPYHDVEWGVPVHDDRRHFELLVLEGAQAGLSWLTVLKRRDGYRRAFADFVPAQVALFDSSRVTELLADPGIIRHRQKVESVVGNAAAVLRVQAEWGTFDDYIWGFTGGVPIVNRWKSSDQVPASTPIAAQLSADLKKRGFRFVGPTVCYSYLQAAGLVLDHVTNCFRFGELATEGT